MQFFVEIFFYHFNVNVFGTSDATQGLLIQRAVLFSVGLPQHEVCIC
jgi:hypothetical protein